MSKPLNFSEHHHHHYIPGHPNQFGPGTWWILHLLSYNVDSEDKIELGSKLLLFGELQAIRIVKKRFVSESVN